MTSESTRGRQVPVGRVKLDPDHQGVQAGEDCSDLELELLVIDVADQILQAAFALSDAHQSKAPHGRGVQIAKDYALTIIGMVVQE